MFLFMTLHLASIDHSLNECFCINFYYSEYAIEIEVKMIEIAVI